MLALCTYEILDTIFILFILIFVVLYFSNFLLCSIKILQANSSRQKSIFCWDKNLQSTSSTNFILSLNFIFYVVRKSTKKLFSIDYVNIYLLFVLFFNSFCLVKNCKVTYRDSFTWKRSSLLRLNNSIILAWPERNSLRLLGRKGPG